MAVTNQLPRIADLTGRIGSLGGKQRGMPIEAADWNALVDVLRGMLEIDRSQEDSAQSTLEQRFALKVHEHLGQVTMAWLDPALQATVNQTSDTGSRVVISDLRQKVDGLGTEVARLTSQLADQQRLIDRFTVNDSDRGRTLQAFDTRFAGVESVKTQVTGISAQLDALNKNVTTVLDLKKSLSDAAGAPIDVGKLKQQVVDLQKLSENFNGADGHPVRLLDVELKFKDLSDAVGLAGKGALDTRLAAASADLEARVNQRADDKLSVFQQQILTSQAQSVAKVTADSKAAVAAALAGNNQAIAAKSAESEARINVSVKDTVTASVKAAQDAITVSTNSAIDQRFAAIPDQVKTAVGAAQTATETRLRADFSSLIDTTVRSQVTAAESRVNTRATDAETKQAAFQKQLQADVQATINAQIATERTALSSSFNAQAAQAQQTIATQVASSVNDAIGRVSTNITAQITDGLNQRTGDLDTRVGRAVTTALQTLPSTIDSTVKQQIAGLDVAGQLQASKTAVITQFRGELNQAMSDQQVRSTAAVSAAITQLRGETATAVKSGSDSAFQRASDLISGVRTDVTTLSTRVNTEVARVDSRITTALVRPITTTTTTTAPVILRQG